MIRFILTLLVRRLVLAAVVLGAANVALGGMMGTAAPSLSVVKLLSDLPKTLDTITRAFR